SGVKGGGGADLQMQRKLCFIPGETGLCGFRESSGGEPAKLPARFLAGIEKSPSPEKFDPLQLEINPLCRENLSARRILDQLHKRFLGEGGSDRSAQFGGRGQQQVGKL